MNTRHGKTNMITNHKIKEHIIKYNQKLQEDIKRIQYEKKHNERIQKNKIQIFNIQMKNEQLKKDKL